MLKVFVTSRKSKFGLVTRQMRGYSKGATTDFLLHVIQEIKRIERIARFEGASNVGMIDSYGRGTANTSSSRVKEKEGKNSNTGMTETDWQNITNRTDFRLMIKKTGMAREQDSNEIEETRQ